MNQSTLIGLCILSLMIEESGAACSTADGPGCSGNQTFF